MIKLKKGDIVDIVAPAGFSAPEQLINAVSELKKWGLITRTFVDYDAFHPFHSDDDNIRLDDFKRAVNATDSKVIWCLRGGYGSARLLDKLARIKKPKNKKLLIGYSDITALHAFVNQKWDWQSIHGPTISTFSNKNFDKKCLLELKKILFGLSKNSEFKLSPINESAEIMHKPIEGHLVGGNLAMIQSLLGTKHSLKTNGAILILEDVNERGYQVDRMLNQLEMSGSLKNVKAIVFGDFSGGLEANGESYIEFALARFALDHKIPVYVSDEFGHGNINRPLILNQKYKIIKNHLIAKLS